MNFIKIVIIIALFSVFLAYLGWVFVLLLKAILKQIEKIKDGDYDND